MLSINIRKSIEEYINNPSISLGESGDASLQRDLKTIAKNSQYYFFVAALMCIIIFISIIYLALTSPNSEYMLAINSISGISLAGLVTLMMKIGKQYTESNFILLLISRLPIDDTKPILSKLIDKQNH